MKSGAALVIVDVQKDFCDGGALAVPDTESLIAPLNEAITFAQQQGDLLIFTQDWHPPNHSSFSSNGGPWPTHCVEHTSGAEFHPGLFVPDEAVVIQKGIFVNSPGYSPFENPQMLGTLQQRDLMRVVVCGIALDYCVRATCLGLVENGFVTVCLTTLTRAIAQDSSEVQEVLTAMSNDGVVLSGKYTTSTT